MTSEEFAGLMHDNYSALNHTLTQHLSMFLNSEQREGFLDFIGVEYEQEDE